MWIAVKYLSLIYSQAQCDKISCFTPIIPIFTVSQKVSSPKLAMWVEYMGIICPRMHPCMILF